MEQAEETEGFRGIITLCCGRELPGNGFPGCSFLSRPPLFFNMNETDEDTLWFELWKCRSLEELRLKCAIYGVDMENWLKTDGHMWIPKDEQSSVLWYKRDD